jgi:hypothetical protein
VFLHGRIGLDNLLLDGEQVAAAIIDFRPMWSAVSMDSRRVPGGAVDCDNAAVRDYPLRPGVAKRDAAAHDGVRVVPADDLNNDVILFIAQPGGFVSERATGEVRYWRACYQDGIGRREGGALTERVQDAPSLGGQLGRA